MTGLVDIAEKGDRSYALIEYLQGKALLRFIKTSGRYELRLRVQIQPGQRIVVVCMCQVQIDTETTGLKEVPLYS